MRHLLLLNLPLLALGTPWWSSGVISFWYAPDNDWPAAVRIVSQHPGLVTSVMAYCGTDVADNGTIIPAFHSTCASLIPALQAVGVRTELATGSGSCSIAAFRALWGDTALSPVVLRDAVLAAGASGLNIDFEPQADSCQGAPTGSAADAVLFAAWLAAVRAQLQPHGLRLTVDVASWSPVLREYSTLAGAVDRLLTMETYNGDSQAQWDGLLQDFVGSTPLAQAGIGLGAWSDSKGAWWETPAAAAHKVNASLAAHAPELAVFRILPSTSAAAQEWPLAFWWPALQAFAHSTRPCKAAPPPTFILSDADMARRFEGIGGISGGGATSRMLNDYPEPTRTQLFDLLFTPQSGAALQTAKVEIPADADTTCGSEVAHRHDAGDGGSCTRGYEGVFLAEASARRPGITTSSLQWAAPSFVGEPGVDSGKSLFTATNIDHYVLPWLRCMQEAYNVTLTWQGAGWNEKPHNTTYIKLMRARLDAQGFAATGLAAADQCCGAGWNIIPELAADAELRSAVATVSTHCAGSLNKQDTPPEAVALGIPLVQGEEHFGLPDPDSVPVWQWPAAAATGVEVSQNWVLSNMTSTVFWPAAYAWASGLEYQGKGFVVATSPWGAAPCYIPTALWVLAHTTHFTTPHTTWLLGGSGSGGLSSARAPLGNGGWNVSYVTYVQEGTLDLTVVVESFLQGGQWHSSRGSSSAGSGEVTAATFQLAGKLLAKWAGASLSVWHTNASVTFERLPPAAVGADGSFAVAIEPGAIYTFTTVPSAHPGAAAYMAASEAAGGCAPAPALAQEDLWPAEAPFPLPYFDDFEGYANDTLPLFTSDMFGAFTVYQLPPGAAAAAAGSPPPLRAQPGIPAAAVACGDAAAVRLRPTRCSAAAAAAAAAPAANNTRVLRQWTRSPPLGWGSGSSNFATLLGNSTLGNVSFGLRALLESPEAGYAPGQAPYVLLGLNGGTGSRSAPPRSFYQSSPAADFVWFSATQWGCSIYAQPAVCASAHDLAFGLDAWHSIVFSEAPVAGGAGQGRVMALTLDGQQLFNVTVGAVRGGGRGGYLLLVTNVRASFDDLSITLNQ